MELDDPRIWEFPHQVSWDLTLACLLEPCPRDEMTKMTPIRLSLSFPSCFLFLFFFPPLFSFVVFCYELHSAGWRYIVICGDTESYR